MDLDLSTLDGYVKANEWVRNNVVLGPKSAEVVSLNVKLTQSDTVVLYMLQSNGYILGFRGADLIYVLDDTSTPDFTAGLVKGGFAKEAKEYRILGGFGADHRSLGTFPGGKPREFHLYDLERAAILSRYSYSGGSTSFQELASALSLLVSIIAEAARHNGVGWQFRKLYQGDPVDADEVFKHWDHAKTIIRLSKKYFPNYSELMAIELLHKRAVEIAEMLDRLGTWSDLQQVLRQVIAGTFRSPDNRVMSGAERLRDLAREMNITNPAALTEIKSAFSHEDAVRAARTGVAGA